MRSRKYGLVTVEHATPSMEFDRDEPCVVFRAQDALALEALTYYEQICIGHGARRNAKAVAEAIQQIAAWQAAHPDRIKLPD
jgi:hypothetical protein